MKTKQLIVRYLQTNSYLIWDEKSREVIILDPGGSTNLIIDQLKKLKLKPKLILATHGHTDHISVVAELKSILNIPFWFPEEDLFLLKRSKKLAPYWAGFKSSPPPSVDKFVKKGDLFKLGRKELKTIGTPGHTPGGLSYYCKGALFSGDIIFANGIGRSDFSYFSERQIIASLKKLLLLPPRTIIYPGHGPVTTINKERENLSFLFD